jgi:hypothetical protein
MRDAHFLTRNARRSLFPASKSSQVDSGRNEHTATGDHLLPLRLQSCSAEGNRVSPRGMTRVRVTQCGLSWLRKSAARVTQQHGSRDSARPARATAHRFTPRCGQGRAPHPERAKHHARDCRGRSPRPSGGRSGVPVQRRCVLRVGCWHGCTGGCGRCGQVGRGAGGSGVVVGLQGSAGRSTARWAIWPKAAEATSSWNRES